MKICQYCRSEIDPMATVCPRCCRDLSETQQKNWVNNSDVYATKSPELTIWDTISVWEMIITFIISLILFYNYVTV